MLGLLRKRVRYGTFLGKGRGGRGGGAESVFYGTIGIVSVLCNAP